MRIHIFGPKVVLNICFKGYFWVRNSLNMLLLWFGQYLTLYIAAAAILNKSKAVWSLFLKSFKFCVVIFVRMFVFLVYTMIHVVLIWNFNPKWPPPPFWILFFIDFAKNVVQIFVSVVIQIQKDTNHYYVEDLAIIWPCINIQNGRVVANFNTTMFVLILSLFQWSYNHQSQ